MSIHLSSGLGVASGVSEADEVRSVMEGDLWVSVRVRARGCYYILTRLSTGGKADAAELVGLVGIVGSVVAGGGGPIVWTSVKRHCGLCLKSKESSSPRCQAFHTGTLS